MSLVTFVGASLIVVCKRSLTRDNSTGAFTLADRNINWESASVNAIGHDLDRILVHLFT